MLGAGRQPQGEIDFDALVPDAVQLLRGGGAACVDGAGDEVRDRLLSGFRHILVDEYQDIDQAQYDLISASAGRTLSDPDQKLSILAVGDDDQNNYTFRGTNVRFIRQFQQDYHAGVHHLVENYRSTANIIAASNQLIAGNQDRMKTEHPICIDHRRGLNPAGGDFGRCDGVVRGRVQCVSVNSPGAMASAVIEEIQRLRRLGVQDWSRMAVIAATHQQLSQVRAIAEREGIPIRWVAGRDLMPSITSVREVHRFLREIVRLGGSFMGVGDLRAILGDLFPDEVASGEPWVGFLSRQLVAWSVESHGASAPVSEVLEFFYESCADARRQGEFGEGVTLSTIHAAKGTEFDHVLLVGSWGAGRVEPRREEARRMLYVGMTRARETLSIFESPTPDGSLVDALEGPGVFRRSHSGVAFPGAMVAYESLGLDGIYLGYPSYFPAYHPIHSALQALRHGSPLSLRKKPDGHLVLCDLTDVVVARLSGVAETRWRPRLASVRTFRVIARVHRWFDAANASETQGRTPEVSEWYVPVVELVCETAAASAE